MGYFATGANGIIVLHVENFVDDRGIVGLRNKAGADTLNLMRTTLTAVENGAGFRFYGYNLDVGILLLQVLACAGNSAACAHSAYENINFPIGIAPDFRTRRSIVLSGIRSILELL